MPDGAESAERYTLTMRVNDTPPYVSGSVQDTCDGCGEAVWLSPATQAEIDRGAYPAEIRCVTCAVEDAEEDDDE